MAPTLPISLVSVDWLKAHEEYIPSRAEEVFEEVLAADGYCWPIVVDSETGIIIDGHHRHHVALRLGLKRVPALLVAYEKDERISVTRWPSVDRTTPTLWDETSPCGAQEGGSSLSYACGDGETSSSTRSMCSVESTQFVDCPTYQKFLKDKTCGKRLDLDRDTESVKNFELVSDRDLDDFLIGSEMPPSPALRLSGAYQKELYLINEDREIQQIFDKQTEDDSSTKCSLMSISNRSLGSNNNSNNIQNYINNNVNNNSFIPTYTPDPKPFTDPNITSLHKNDPTTPPDQYKYIYIKKESTTVFFEELDGSVRCSLPARAPTTHPCHHRPHESSSNDHSSGLSHDNLDHTRERHDNNNNNNVDNSPNDVSQSPNIDCHSRQQQLANIERYKEHVIDDGGGGGGRGRSEERGAMVGGGTGEGGGEKCDVYDHKAADQEEEGEIEDINNLSTSSVKMNLTKERDESKIEKESLDSINHHPTLPSLPLQSSSRCYTVISPSDSLTKQMVLEVGLSPHLLFPPKTSRHHLPPELALQPVHFSLEELQEE